MKDEIHIQHQKLMIHVGLFINLLIVIKLQNIKYQFTTPCKGDQVIHSK